VFLEEIISGQRTILHLLSPWRKMESNSKERKLAY